MLDDLRIAHLRSLGVAARLAQRAALAEQIPALVEPDLDRLQPAMLVVAKRRVGGTRVQVVLLGHEFLDAVVDAFVSHSYLPAHGCTFAHGSNDGSSGAERLNTAPATAADALTFASSARSRTATCDSVS